MKKTAATWITRGDIVRYEGHDYAVTSVRMQTDERGASRLVFDLRPCWPHIAEGYGLPPLSGVSYRKVERKPGPAGLRELLRLG